MACKVACSESSWPLVFWGRQWTISFCCLSPLTCVSCFPSPSELSISTHDSSCFSSSSFLPCPAWEWASACVGACLWSPVTATLEKWCSCAHILTLDGRKAGHVLALMLVSIEFPWLPFKSAYNAGFPLIGRLGRSKLQCFWKAARFANGCSL